jgi:predicted pyridoxine 5'-phosphate oxidase superfamily flavin-nucleotide-binding protein
VTLAILTPEIQRFVREQRLGFVATVGGDGRPNLSPKGTTTVWDDGHLMFADIASPQTVANLAVNPHELAPRWLAHFAALHGDLARRGR